MPQSKYEPIYHAIKKDIESMRYKSGDFLPSENEYAAHFVCSRNTVRRAISLLTAEGYLLPQHGRGVQVIYHPEKERSLFTIGGIESFTEAASRSSRKATTKIITFKEIKCDQAMSLMTGFDTGEDLYFIERVRYFGKQAVIYDTNIFMISETKGLSEEIACDSIYRYLEDTLGMTITTSRRRVTAERATERDHELLDLGHFDFVLTVVGQVFNSRGVMFEYTCSRHVPDQVCFTETAVRQKV